jgi:hypothetical protein
VGTKDRPAEPKSAPGTKYVHCPIFGNVLTSNYGMSRKGDVWPDETVANGPQNAPNEHHCVSTN